MINFNSKFTFQPKRFVFQQEMSPKSPESFKAPEKASDAQIAAEVAPMSPSQIVANTWSAGGAAATKHIQNTQALAGIFNDPLLEQTPPATSSQSAPDQSPTQSQK